MKVTLFVLTLIFSFTQLLAQSKYDSLEYVIKGSVSALRSKSIKFYLEKDDSLIFLQPTIRKTIEHGGVNKIMTTYPYKGTLSYNLRSCEKIDQVINSISLNESGLIKVLTKYYACTNEKPAQVESSAKRTAIKLGVNGGYQITQLEVESLPDYNPDANKKGVFGLSYEFLSLKRNVAFAGQFNLTKYEFVDKDDFMGRGTNYNQLQTKLGLKKYFGKKLKPFIKGAVVFNYNYNIEQTPTPYGFYTARKLTFNFEGGAGIEQALNDKIATSLELDYGVLNFDLNYDGFVLIPQPLTIQLTVYYRIK